MSAKLDSKNYTFSKLLSENSLVQTWLATKNKSGENCIIKTISASNELDDNTKNSFLLKSFEAQQNIKTKSILTAKRKTVENGNLLIEYPYLNPADWRSLTLRDFWLHFPNSLIQICLVVDYIHLLDLVHCDLKLGNFMLNIKNGKPKICLIDLDFLCFSGTSPMAKIYGSPNYIAPEIIENRKIIRQTDNYSVGIILSECIDFLKKGNGIQVDESDISINKINSLIKKLTMKQAESRPLILINALAQLKIINKQELEFGQKTILTSLLISKYWTEKAGSLKKKTGLNDLLINKTNIYGLHQELIEDLNYVFLKKPAKFLQILKYLITKSTISLYDHYWQIDVSDEIIDFIYKNAKSSYGWNPSVDYILHDINEIGHLIDLAKRINNSDKNIPSLKSYLQLQKAVDQYDEINIANKEYALSEILNALSKLAVFLGRSNEAIAYLTNLLQLQQDDDKAVLDILYRLSFLEITRHRFAEANIWIEKGLTTKVNVEEGDIQGDLLRLKAWILSQRGEHGQSKKLLLMAENMAKAGDHDNLLAKVQHDFGMLFWRQGDYSKAEKYLLRSAVLKQKYGSKVGLSASYVNLSLLYFGQSNYKKAVNYGELSLNIAGKESDNTILDNVFMTLAVAQSRLNNVMEVSRWLESIRATNSFKNNRLAKQKYYFCKAATNSNLGNYQAALESFEIGKQFVHANDPKRGIAEAEIVLAKIALYQGKPSDCTDHIKNAKSLFEDLHDNASLSEVELIEKLNNEINLEKDQQSELMKILRELIKSRCFYYGAVCLIYMLLTRNGNEISSALKISFPLLPLIKSSEIPLFKAISQLAGTRGNILRKRHFDITRLKNCFGILDASGDKFFALLLCEKIAEHYLSNSQIKLAFVFLKHADQIAINLDNRRFSDTVKEKIKSLNVKSTETFLVQKTILGISEIISDINDYETAVTKLLQFVVQETGAERGALLIASADNPKKLQIKSSINCDKASLKDIENISRSIPAHVSKQQKPLIIEDALNHKQTKEFKSIVIHNIRSVICIPIAIKDRNIGVLYLDHHTIPGLFDIGDILFVKSIGNFISTVLSSLHSFKEVDISRQQFKKQLEALGLTNKIIYCSKVMSELFDNLPNVAKSNASVLILGESGTGKELICNMIHKLSLRANAPLVKLNSSAIANSLIESELFGVARKVATGVEPREGKFSAADGGTLFLDEIGDMPIEIQAKVLRVVDDQTFEKVGSNNTISIDVRYIYATNKNLKVLIDEGKFREDLYYRINTIEIVVPPLRSRPEDIPELIDHFLASFISDKSEYPTFSEGSLFCMLSYKWPGNVRELRNLIERFCILFKGQEIKIENLPIAIAESDGADSELLLKAKIYELLQKYDWNQTKVAEILEIPLTTLRRKIRKFNLHKDKK